MYFDTSKEYQIKFDSIDSTSIHLFTGNGDIEHALSNGQYFVPKTKSMRLGMYIKTSSGTSYNNIQIKCKDSLDANPKSDKKRLLYYNEETQTWEKPILREWDCIEKHTDGKYYYLHRSGEVVLNGSEAISIYRNDDTLNTIAFATRVANDALTSSAWDNCICLSDKFNTIKMQPIYVGIDKECATISNGNHGVIINISKNKLSTQDVQGFKQWLQANNVTVVYQLAQEKVYECTNIDLITYANETN